jgi:hypothetical protein
MNCSTVRLRSWKAAPQGGGERREPRNQRRVLWWLCGSSLPLRHAPTGPVVQAQDVN